MPQKVGVITLSPGPVAVTHVLPGRAVAYEQAQVRPRVTGTVVEQIYTPGQHLTKGAPMFRLDAVSYEAAVAQARAALAGAEAALPLAQSTLDRASQLENVGSTRVDVDSARAALAQAKANVQSARAALDLAEAQLSWTRVDSPIDGVAGLPQVSVGDLATAGQTGTLANVTRIDPIYADMIETTARDAGLRQDVASGTMTAAPAARLRVALEDGTPLAQEGTLVAPSVDVSTTTGTRVLRFTLANPDGRVLPGMFLRGTITLGQIEAFLVPQMAATRGRDGSLTAWIVAEGDKAHLVTLTEVGVQDNAWIVKSGLDAGARVIVDGLAGLAEGDPVTPVPVTIDAAGVVHDVTAGSEPAVPAAGPAARAGN